MSKLPYLLPLAACCTIASAQVYQSIDEQGNPIYSDRPSTDSQQIEIPEPNVGDAVEVPPTLTEPAPGPEQRPRIEADQEPGAVEGEMIPDRPKTRSRRPRPVHLPSRSRRGS